MILRAHERATRAAMPSIIQAQGGRPAARENFMNTTPLLASLFGYKAWANEELLAQMRSLDAQAHGEHLHAALRTLNHTFVVDRIFAAHLTGAQHDYAATNTNDTPGLDELQSALARSDRWYVDYVAGLTPAELAQHVRFTFTDGLAGRMSREEILAHLITHGGYHRGAIGRILLQASVPPPRDTYTVFLHRTQPERRSAG